MNVFQDLPASLVRPCRPADPPAFGAGEACNTRRRPIGPRFLRRPGPRRCVRLARAWCKVCVRRPCRDQSRLATRPRCGFFPGAAPPISLRPGDVSALRGRTRPPRIVLWSIPLFAAAPLSPPRPVSGHHGLPRLPATKPTLNAGGPIMPRRLAGTIGNRRRHLLVTRTPADRASPRLPRHLAAAVAHMSGRPGRIRGHSRRGA